ncbi:conserved hypothetical protein [Pyrobaculum neutrophilum V24Sta]|uniref:Glycosyltransferase RgtA/B/C/D-like domain-containing protein n=2 Tax=Pyrobaculum neutrophilum TaxID=70771 RepID=B1YC94_PYRNV|nr:conserved hypothetical protein [Pyrobaculum neutrophilum V24Sta]
MLPLYIPYLCFYLQQLWLNASWLPRGDDYPIHVYFALLLRGDPAAVFTTPWEYPGIPHLLGLLWGDPLALGRAFAVYAAALALLGVALYGLYFKAAGVPAPFLASFYLVTASVRTLAGLVDGQIADKTVLLVFVPLSLYLYARGRPAAAVAALAPSIFTNYLGVAYGGLLSVMYAVYGGRRARLALAVYIALVAVLLWHKALSVLELAGQAASAPPMPWDPGWGLVYAFYGSSPAVLIPLALLGLRKRAVAPLAAASLLLLVIGAASSAYGERLYRVAALLLPASAAASGWTGLALAAYSAFPAAGGWAWALGALPGLYQPVDRITPGQLDAYRAVLAALPSNSTVEVQWSLDPWLLPLAYAYRPDVRVNLTACRWTRADFYVYTPPDPRQWYMPCIREVGPPPGVRVASWGSTALYRG